MGQMKSGMLKQLVMTIIQEKGPTSTREVLNEIITLTKNDYAYTTISTIIRRLHKQDLIESTDVQIYGRHLKKYVMKNNVPKKEIRNALSSIIGRFGLVGVQYLSELFKSKLTDEELEEIKKEFELNSNHTLNSKERGVK